MMWWDIIKFSRNDAYQLFLEAFGTNAELPEIEMRMSDGMRAEPYMYSGGFGIGFNFITTKLEFKLIKAPLQLHREFILGMFESEYPDRYDEIRDKLLDASRIMEGENFVPTTLSTNDSIDWLNKHEFYSSSNERFDMSRRGVRRNLLKALLEYYDGISYGEASKKMSNVGLAYISVSPNLSDTFTSWRHILTGKSDAEKTYSAISYASTIMGVARDINSGKLDNTTFMQEISGPVRIRRIKED